VILSRFDSLSTNDRFAIGDRGLVPADIHATVISKVFAYRIEVPMLLMRWFVNVAIPRRLLGVDLQVLLFGCGYCSSLDVRLRWRLDMLALGRCSAPLLCSCLAGGCELLSGLCLVTVSCSFSLTDVPALFTVVFLAGLFGDTSANLPTDPTSDINCCGEPWMGATVFGILSG